MKVGSRLVIDAGIGGGIGYGFCDSMENSVIDEKKIMDRRIDHTIKEVENGQGPAPIKTDNAWRHVAYSTVDRLVDYCVNTPEDGLHSAACVQQCMALVKRN